ncbi:MAG: hypothetical protein ACREDH_00095, partial [Methylocella sp.]
MLRPSWAPVQNTVIPSEARNLLFSFLLATRHLPLATSLSKGGPMNLSDWRRRIDEIDKKLV